MARLKLKKQQLGLGLCLFALTALSPLPQKASAHSQPGVSGILDEDATGVQMLRLYQGIVQRVGAKWRFVCSKTYGGGGQDLAGPLPGGGIAIALPVGIAIMKRDGSVLPHPDPEGQQGVLTAFARSKDKLYALRWRDQFKVSDVVEITESTVRVLWTDTHSWSDIAVGEGSLALVRFEQDVIEDLRLSFAGEVLSEDVAPLVDARAVTVRVMGDVPYYAARLQNQSLLGRIEQGAWHTVLTAGNALAGPLALPDGTALVALDGVLSSFANDVATPLTNSDSDFITGLYQLDSHPYACTRTGLRDINSAGLGAPLFDMSELLGPDECAVPAEARSDCELEWQHLVVELLGASIPIASDDTSTQVCAVADANGATITNPGNAGSNGSGSAGAFAAMGMAGESGSAAAVRPAGQTDTAGASGCACGITPRAPRLAAACLYTLMFVCALFFCPRRKNR